MAPFSVGRFPLGLLCVLLALSASGMSQALLGKSLPVTPPVIENCPTRPSAATPAFPSAVVGCGLHLEYIGVYNPEGQFKALSKMDRWSLKVGSTGSGESGEQRAMRPVEVPPSLSLRPRERIVADYDPSFHAKKLVRGESHYGGMLNSIVTFVYGHERPLLAPQHVTTDSRGRAIISDPAVPAVHVLDGKDSFRIVGGPHHRLQNPGGVAVDADNNIYVADSKLGLVLVYDPAGRFLRLIGKIDDTESMFHYPTGLAIDAKRGRLYVVDAMRERVFVLDLRGALIDRIGIPRDEEGATFDYPTDIALSDGELVVLDKDGSRIQVMDLEGRLRAGFVIGVNHHLHKNEKGVAVDTNHNIYVSNVSDSDIRVYGRNGVWLGSFGRRGLELGEFESPEGLWIDSNNQVFVTDTSVRRIQVFKVDSVATSIASSQ